MEDDWDTEQAVLKEVQKDFQENIGEENLVTVLYINIDYLEVVGKEVN